jgi:hypothetical protein
LLLTAIIVHEAEALATCRASRKVRLSSFKTGETCRPKFNMLGLIDCRSSLAETISAALSSAFDGSSSAMGPTVIGHLHHVLGCPKRSTLERIEQIRADVNAVTCGVIRRLPLFSLH